jgi:hypothetical protein
MPEPPRTLVQERLDSRRSSTVPRMFPRAPCGSKVRASAGTVPHPAGNAAPPATSRTAADARDAAERSCQPPRCPARPRRPKTGWTRVRHCTLRPTEASAPAWWRRTPVTKRLRFAFVSRREKIRDSRNPSLFVASAQRRDIVVLAMRTSPNRLAALIFPPPDLVWPPALAGPSRRSAPKRHVEARSTLNDKAEIASEVQRRAHPLQQARRQGPRDQSQDLQARSGRARCRST